MCGGSDYKPKGIINHSKLITEFSDALATIGDALCLAKLNAELFQTNAMRDTISQLYAHLLLFLQQAMRWYNHSPAGRAFHSIFKPLEYQDTVEQIKVCAQAVNDIASAASRTEIRDIHITIQLMQQHSRQREQRLVEMQAELLRTQQAQLEMVEKVDRVLQTTIGASNSRARICASLTY